MKTERELQDALLAAIKRYDAEKWMQDRNIPRVDHVPHHVAVERALMDMIHAQLDVLDGNSRRAP